MSALRAGVPTSSIVPGSTLSLRALESGRQAVVVAVGPGAADELAREGIIPGSELVVAARAPFGGPTIVVLGHARLAVSADLAAAVEVVEGLGSAAHGPADAAEAPRSGDLPPGSDTARPVLRSASAFRHEGARDLDEDGRPA